MSAAAAFLARALVVGLVFAAARTIAAVVLEPGRAGEALGASAVELAAGVVVGQWLQLLVDRSSGDRPRVALVLCGALFLNLLAVMIEGAAFEPAAQDLSRLPHAAVLQLLVSIVVARVAVSAGRPAVPPSVARVATHRSLTSWIGRYLVCVAVYVALYFVIGAASFTFVTGSYYRAGVAGLLVPPPTLVLLVAAVEGLLLPLAVAPLAYSLSGSRLRRALLGGCTVAVLGGIVPLIVAPSLPLFLRFASGFEILFQKVPAGAAAVALLGPDTGRQAPPPSAPSACCEERRGRPMPTPPLARIRTSVATGLRTSALSRGGSSRAM